MESVSYVMRIDVLLYLFIMKQQNTFAIFNLHFGRIQNGEHVLKGRDDQLERLGILREVVDDHGGRNLKGFLRLGREIGCIRQHQADGHEDS